MPPARVTFHGQFCWVGRGWGRCPVAGWAPGSSSRHGSGVTGGYSEHVEAGVVQLLCRQQWALWWLSRATGASLTFLVPPRSLFRGPCSGGTCARSLSLLCLTKPYFAQARLRCSDAFSSPPPLPSIPGSLCPSSNSQQSSVCDFLSVCLSAWLSPESRAGSGLFRAVSSVPGRLQVPRRCQFPVPCGP